MNARTERVFFLCMLLKAGVSLREINDLDVGEAKGIVAFQKAIEEKETKRWNKLFGILKQMGGMR